MSTAIYNIINRRNTLHHDPEWSSKVQEDQLWASHKNQLRYCWPRDRKRRAMHVRRFLRRGNVLSMPPMEMETRHFLKRCCSMLLWSRLLTKAAHLVEEDFLTKGRNVLSPSKAMIFMLESFLGPRPFHLRRKPKEPVHFEVFELRIQIMQSSDLAPNLEWKHACVWWVIKSKPSMYRYVTVCPTFLDW